MKQLHIVVDMQFGSTGKGLIVGYLAEKVVFPDTVITAWGPNAGHTYIDAQGDKFVNIALPNSIVSPNLKRILIGPGSIIDPEIFMQEYELNKELLEEVEILIHPHAAVVSPHHKTAEQSYGFKIGSTMKGVGAAVIQKIRREPPDLNVAKAALVLTELDRFVTTVQGYQSAIDEAEVVMIEGAQGYSLSINHGFYPYTTSRDCTVQQLMVDCAIPREIGCRPTVVGVARTYPIRVANRYNEAGKQVGTSGPYYPDQQELTWAEIGQPVELTTVTKLPRRVFSFSEQQVAEAIRMNGIDAVFLNFCNYLGTRDEDVEHLIRLIEAHGTTVRWTGWGPTVNDIRSR